MKIKILWLYLAITGLLAAGIFLYSYNTHSAIATHPEIFAIETVQYNDRQLPFYEFKIHEGTRGLFKYEVRILGEQLPKKNLSLVVSGLRGTWHRFYWNGQFIGSIGDSRHSSQNTWNRTYSFFIAGADIATENQLHIETYSDYKLGLTRTPLLLMPSESALAISDRLNLLQSPLYTVIFWTLLVLSATQVITFLASHYQDHRYALLPLGVVLIAFYLLDYCVFSYAPLAPLVMKKLLLTALYSAVLIMSYVIWVKYRLGNYLKAAFAAYLTAVTLTWIAPNLVQLNSHYSIANLLMLTQISLWAYWSGKAAWRNKRDEDALLFSANITLLIPTAIDAFHLMMTTGPTYRLSAFGFVFYAVALLITASKHYLDAQKQLYATSQQLLVDHRELHTALTTDELTGLGNHRGCIGKLKEHCKAHKPTAVLLIDLDKFRAINNALGHATGDLILQRMAVLLSSHLPSGDLYRYGGEEFVVLLPDAAPSLELSAWQWAEQVRQLVLMDDALGSFSQYHPLSISIGIALYPQHSNDAAMLISMAEKACDFSKACGRNTVQIFNDKLQMQLKGFAQVSLKQELLNDFALTLAATIDLKDTYTSRHSDSVARFATRLGDLLDLSHQQRYALRIGSLLHDLGKIAIADDILHKDGPLTREEYKAIQKHTTLGANLIAQVVEDRDVISCVRYHHERYDGTGYPEALAGENIPLMARIVSIADAYHAMVSDRSYRAGVSKEEALERLAASAGTHFDPTLVQLFIVSMQHE